MLARIALFKTHNFHKCGCGKVRHKGGYMETIGIFFILLHEDKRQEEVLSKQLVQVYKTLKCYENV